MKMKPIKLAQFRLPYPWAPIDNDHESLAHGLMLYKGVADTVQKELHREICEEHPLYGTKCRPIAWDTFTKKDFLFTTNKSETPCVLVHFTWVEETDPSFPYIVEFRCFDDFIMNEIMYYEA